MTRKLREYAELENQLLVIDERLAECSYNVMTNLPCQSKQYARSKLAILMEMMLLLDEESAGISDRQRQLIQAQYQVSAIEHQDNISDLKEEINECVCSYWRKSGLGFSERHSILCESTCEAERRDAWEHVYPLANEVSTKYKTLVELRNENARKHGYVNFSAMKMLISGMCPDGATKLCREYLGDTEEEYTVALTEKARLLGVTKESPWNTSYLLSTGFEREHRTQLDIENAIDLVFGKLGFQLRSMPIEIELTDVPYGAVCISFRPGGKTVVLINQCGSIEDFGYTLHEVTHALQNIIIV
ncbi:hypothetical protein CSA37_02670 [Candidatus Fermentibacteria bacterium]|nr:MAG: hypothetical protein CSA37_09125 [Candidatus Fermentibacteria bacterium]PIE53262.1 MAG: hypothetical protein CSA37_02670 [Candidatus Fermentibacteria bacterium]